MECISLTIICPVGGHNCVLKGEFKYLFLNRGCRLIKWKSPLSNFALYAKRALYVKLMCPYELAKVCCPVQAKVNDEVT